MVPAQAGESGRGLEATLAEAFPPPSQNSSFAGNCWVPVPAP